MYDYLNEEQENKLATMLCCDSYSIESILSYVDKLMSNKYEEGLAEGFRLNNINNLMKR